MKTLRVRIFTVVYNNETNGSGYAIHVENDKNEERRDRVAPEIVGIISEFRKLAQDFADSNRKCHPCHSRVQITFRPLCDMEYSTLRNAVRYLPLTSEEQDKFWRNYYRD